MNFLSIEGRVQCALVCGLAGGALGQTLSFWGGTLSHFLPGATVMGLSGAFGAALAMFLMVDVFGHRGVRGALLGAVAWGLATWMGACFGAAALSVQPDASLFYVILSALENGSGLGLIAVVNGVTTSPEAFAVWVMGGCAVQRVTQSARTQGALCTLT